MHEFRDVVAAHLAALEQRHRVLLQAGAGFPFIWGGVVFYYCLIFCCLEQRHRVLLQAGTEFGGGGRSGFLL